MALDNYQHTTAERFMRYVQIDTQSDANSPTQPSTEKQKDLSRLLVEELKAIGINDAELDEHGYVYATIPATTDKDVPVICYCRYRARLQRQRCKAYTTQSMGWQRHCIAGR
jgi:tripeptide aminopeptidase